MKKRGREWEWRPRWQHRIAQSGFLTNKDHELFFKDKASKPSSEELLEGWQLLVHSERWVGRIDMSFRVVGRQRREGLGEGRGEAQRGQHCRGSAWISNGPYPHFLDLFSPLFPIFRGWTWVIWVDMLTILI